MGRSELDLDAVWSDDVVRLLLDLYTAQMRNLVEYSDRDVAWGVACYDRLDGRRWFDLGLERLGPDSDRRNMAVPTLYVDRLVVS